MKRIGRSISDYLSHKIIDERIVVRAEWLPGRKPAESQPQILEKKGEVKAETPAPVETPKPALVQVDLNFEKPAETIEQPVEKPVIGEKKEEVPKTESPKPTQPKPQPTPRKRIAFKCDVPPSKIKTWIRQLSTRDGSNGIQEKLISAGPVCVEHLMRHVDDDKAFTSSRQIAANTIVKIWEKYSKDKNIDSRKEIILLYADEVLPFSDKLEQNIKGYTDDKKRVFKEMESEVKKLKQGVLDKDGNKKNLEAKGQGKDI